MTVSIRCKTCKISLTGRLKKTSTLINDDGEPIAMKLDGDWYCAKDYNLNDPAGNTYYKS